MGNEQAHKPKDERDRLMAALVGIRWAVQGRVEVDTVDIHDAISVVEGQDLHTMIGEAMHDARFRYFRDRVFRRRGIDPETVDRNNEKWLAKQRHADPEEP